MGLGILEPKSGGDVPGTTRYFEKPDRSDQAALGHAGALKVDSSGSTPIILSPQPTDDPNDPLNWPLWRRDLITLILCFAGILATSLGSILASNTFVISEHFGIALTDTAVLTGYYLLGAGAAAIFCVPSGRVWGKRHLFLLGICIIVVSSAWAGSVGSNGNSFLAARIVQGVGTAPFESLLNAAVGDLYHVHQSGLRMAFTNLAVFGGAFFTPVAVGKMTSTLGWQWTFFFITIFMAMTLPAAFLLCPETAFRRDPDHHLLHAAVLGAGEDKLDAKEGSASPQLTAVSEASARPDRFVLFPTSAEMQPVGNAATPRKTLLQSLSFFDGRKTRDRYWVLLLRPFPLLLNPAFIWGCLIQGTMVGWTVFIGVLIAFVFKASYQWGEVETGYTYIGPFVGAIAGFVVSGLMADSSTRYLTKLNGGIYEPEFRILLVVPMLIIGCIGLYGFGIAADDITTGGFHFLVPPMFFGFEVAGMVIGTVASSLYIVDAYRDLTIEAFTLWIIFKNMFAFVLTKYAFQWLFAGGLRQVFIAVATIQVGICLLSIPMWIYGKRIRAFFHHHDVLTATRLR